MNSWPRRVFCDTSFFFACLEARDAHHAQAVAWLEQSERRQTAFWTTWEVIGETVTLLRRRSGYDRAQEFIRQVVPALHTAELDGSARQESLEVFLRFAQDKELSLCDCISFVVLTTRLAHTSTATFDKHFQMLGLPILR
ncbi:MAG: PIN domain-containing protein [Elusimicrobia bacterium]|nr:PIN domain-containing protein [Elusimicrobiota bacterium]